MPAGANETKLLGINTDPQYDLPENAIRYISIVNLNESTSGTTYLYVYLKILVPTTSTYIF